MDVAEVQPQVAALSDRHDVIHVEVALAGREGDAQLLERLVAQDVEPKRLRLEALRRHPTAFDAAPAVALEAGHSQTAVVAVVAALGRRAAGVVVHPIRRSSTSTRVLLAARVAGGRGVATAVLLSLIHI